MATRQPRARKAPTKTASALLEALRFISVAQHNDNNLPLFNRHCRLTNGTLMAFDGGLTVGIYVDETISCAPHTETFIKALSLCGEQIAITLLDSERLQVKSGKLGAKVPCAPLDKIAAGWPDPPCGVITDAIKPALAACLTVARDGEPSPGCGVLLQAGTCAATDKRLFIEAWHGENLPSVFLPRISAKTVAECKKTLTKFGFSENSFTFYFEDESFIKTQLFKNDFPKYDQILDVEVNPWPLPGGFYEGLEHVSPFCDNIVYFLEGKMSSSSKLEDASTYDVDGLPIGMIYNIAQLKALRQFIAKIDFKPHSRAALFFSQDGLVRGAIAHHASSINGQT